MFKKDELVAEAKDAISYVLSEGYTGSLYDLHNEIFNNENYNDNEEEAIHILDKMGGWSAAAACLEFEKNNFGEVSTEKYGDPVWVLSMIWYIIGEEVLSEFVEACPLAEKHWDDPMTEDESEILSEKFERIFQF